MSQTKDLLKLRPIAAQLPTYKPTIEEEKYISQGLAYLVVRAPFFAHLFYHECRLLYTRHIPYAATDGKNIFVNPAGLQAEKMGIYEIAFVLAHEISHVLFGDLLLAQVHEARGYVLVGTKQYPYSHEAMNAAEDYVINAMLIDARIGKMPQIGLFDKNLSEKGMEGNVVVYEKLITTGKIKFVTAGFDQHLAPSQGQIDAETTGARQQAIASAAEAARASGQGTIPGAAQRIIGEILEPKVDWRQHLRSTMMRASGDAFWDWRYLDTRLMARPDPMYFARQGHQGAGTVIVAIDTSGSISNQVLNIFLSEVQGIVQDLNPMNLHVIWCDAAIHRTDELEEVDDLAEYREVLKADGGPGGGGGTSFVPPFVWMEEEGHEPDIFVYLTDMHGRFPANEPNFPVVWASITEGKQGPFGETIHVDIHS